MTSKRETEVGVIQVAKKARIGLYLENESIKEQIKIASAKRGTSTTAYCEEAIKERLIREGEISDKEDISKKALLSRIDELRRKIGPIGVPVSELVREGRRR